MHGLTNKPCVSTEYISHTYLHLLKLVPLALLLKVISDK